MIPSLRKWLAVVVASMAISAGAADLADYGIYGEGYVTFVGHYGETLKLRGGWEIQASMQGEVEVINHYPLDPGQPDLKASDFVPENFSRDSLIQLIIMPWSASSSKSLVELKRLKIEDLKSSGVNFRIIDDPFPGYGHMGRKWPEGTFEVLIATPYVLSQLYTTSGAHLAILTTGWDTPPSSVISSHYDLMRSGLRDWIVPATGKEVLKAYGPVPAPAIPEKGISLRVLAKPWIWMTWVLLNGIACLIFGILGITKHWEPLRRASLSLLILSNAGALIGGLVGLAFWPFTWSSQHLTVPPAVACLFMPLLAWFAGSVRGRRPRRRVLVGVAVWALALSAFLSYIGLAWNWGSDWSPHVPANTAVNTFILYAIGGIIYGFLDSTANEISGRRALLSFIFLIVSVRTVWAQPGPVLVEKSTPNPIDSKALVVAQQNLAKHKLDRESFMNKAVTELRKTQVLYDYQRVEIKGIFAKDLTAKTIPKLFDLEIGASHIGSKGNSITTPAWVQNILNHSNDLRDLSADAHGQFTEAAQAAVEALQGKEINELVAHSWGTEIVYNAILHGRIKPPRRLIVCGMPDRDLQKWLSLSQHTGTEVVVYPNTRDPIAGAARIGGTLIDALAKAEEAKGGRLVVPTPEEARFEADWIAACQNRPCNPHARKPAPIALNTKYLGRSHDRLRYYGEMLKDGTIPFDSADAYVLRDRQEAKVMAEADRLYSLAVGREASNLRPESVKAMADKDFLSIWQQDAGKISGKAKAAAERQNQEQSERERLAREREELERQARVKKAQREIELRDINMSVLAARCGYELEYAGQDRTIIGFHETRDRYQDRHVFKDRVLPETLTDFELMLAVSRACDDAERDPSRKGIKACNNAPDILPNQIGLFRGFHSIRAANERNSVCINHMLDDMMNFKNRKSFERSISDYQTALRKKQKRNKELEDNLRAYQERVKRGEDRPPRDDDRTSPDDGKLPCVWDSNIGGRVCPD